MKLDINVTQRDLINFAIKTSLTLCFSYYMSKKILNLCFPESKKEEEAKAKTDQLLENLNIKLPEKLSGHELQISCQIICPKDLHSSWSDIAGLDYVSEELNEAIKLPLLQRSHSHSSKLLQPPKGILLHGPPGCGKTMVAKAVAAESGLTFINLDISTLTDKYFGESQKLCSALFSVAEKVEPCIIFIDEIDSFLRSRNSFDGETTAMMKSLFLQYWDGLATDKNKCVIVMGATNRPQDVDPAFWRRMPVKIPLPLPDADQRESILKVILKEEEIDDYVDLKSIATRTAGLSGSDLRELCRSASILRLKDFNSQNPNMSPDSKVGSITMEHLNEGLCKTIKSKCS